MDHKINLCFTNEIDSLACVCPANTVTRRVKMDEIIS